MYDVIIIGGGPAGLSAALTLGRAKREILVIDEEKPRSQVTRFSHGYLTRDGVKPGDFRKTAREELSKYHLVDYINDLVLDVHRHEKQFKIGLKKEQNFIARKILFATGLRDVLPEVRGFNEVYGKSAFICPYCDGWEFRDQSIAIIGSKLSDVHFVKALHGWSHDIALFTNGPHQLEEKQIEGFRKKQVPIYEEKISEIEHENGIVNSIVLDGGQRISRSAIFFNPGVKQASLIPHSLGVALNENDIYITEEDGKTNVEGLYIAGDSRNHLHQIIHAASDGSKAAVGINMELLKEDWAHF